MKLLIDTHILIWHGEKNENLAAAALDLLEDPANTVWVSQASIWEIAIKVSLGKLEMPISIDLLEKEIVKNGFNILPFRSEHFVAVSRLPFHHNDPFDRMLIAQAVCDGLVLMTHDEKFRHYPVQLA